MPDATTPTVPTFCALCVSRCGATPTITDGRFVALGPAPEHPTGSAGIAAGDWVLIETPLGSVRSRAELNAGLDPGVVCGQHGWWQACDELGLPGYPPTGPGSANLNAVLAQGPSDPVSGSSPLRSSVCDVVPLPV